MSLLIAQPGFSAFQPYFHFEPDMKTLLSDRIRWRIYLRYVPFGMLEAAKAFLMPCVRCSKLIHPFRFRESPSWQCRAPKNLPKIYVAVSCEDGVDRDDRSCVSSNGATQEYDDLVAFFQARADARSSSQTPAL